jgi:hypothetical protein
MSVMCLYFPRLAVELARANRPELRSRPLVFVDGVGGEARVAQRSAEAASRGVLVGMRAADARPRVPQAAFLAHRCEEHIRRLIALAGDLSRQTGLPVSVATDALIVPLQPSALPSGERAFLQSLVVSIEQTTGLSVAAGIGESADDALVCARLEARRGTGRTLRSA